MTYMLLLNCALKLVEEIILYYDARSKKHQITCKLIKRLRAKLTTSKLLQRLDKIQPLTVQY